MSTCCAAEEWLSCLFPYPCPSWSDRSDYCQITLHTAVNPVPTAPWAGRQHQAGRSAATAQGFLPHPLLSSGPSHPQGLEVCWAVPRAVLPHGNEPPRRILSAVAISEGLFHTSSCTKVTDQMVSVSSQVLVHFKLDLSPAVKSTFGCSQGREIHSSGAWECSLAGKGMNADAEAAML